MKTLPISILLWLLYCALPTFCSIPAIGQELKVRTNYYAIVLHYDPLVWKDGHKQPVSQIYHSRDIDTLCRDYTNFLRKASGGQVNWTIIAKHVLDEFPPDNDPDVTFTAENYVALREQGYDLFDHGHPNYAAICNDSRFGIVSKVDAAELDAIWVFAPEGTGFWETAMAGRGAFYVNGGAYPEVNTSRKFIIYGFGSSSHQGVGFMLENTGHMTEVILNTRIMGFWPRPHAVKGWNTLDLNNPARTAVTNRLHDWSLFTTSDSVHWGAELVAPNRAHCGLSHFPPTALYNYGWSAPRYNFGSPWEADAFQVYGGQGGIEDGDYLLPANPVGIKAMLMGSHNLRDDRGGYRVPMIVADADLQTGIALNPAGNGHAGLLFRCSLYTNGLSAVRGYYLGLVPGSHTLELARVDHAYVPVASCHLPVVPGAYYRLLLSLRGNTARIFLPPCREPLMVYDGLLETDGAVGMTSYGRGARFSHFHVEPVVLSAAESWRDYPVWKRPPNLITPKNWRGDDQPYNDMDYWYAWWYEHLPKNPGTHEIIDPGSGLVIGRGLNSWWPYIFDINTFDSPFLPMAPVVTPAADTQAPAAPAQVRAYAPSSTRIDLAWEEPFDDVGVTRYELSRDGGPFQESPKPDFTDETLEPAREYRYKVRAIDGSGNRSEFSPELRVRTPALDPLVLNPQFEHGLNQPTPWTASAFDANCTNSWDTEGGRANSRCIQIDSRSAFNDAHWSQHLTGLIPNGAYRISCWVKGCDIEPETGSYVGANLCSLGTWDHSAILLTGTFDWTQIYLDGRADAAGNLTIGCRLGYWANLAKGQVWFDDVEVTPALDDGSSVIQWGDLLSLLNGPPENATNALLLDVGDAHALALLEDRSVVSWGDNTFGQTNVPLGLAQVVCIAAGAQHSLAVLADGSFAGWGNNSFGQTAPPPGSGPWKAVAAGADFSLALNSAGQVSAWGRNDSGQCRLPPSLGRIVGIGAGHQFAMALDENGLVSAWGRFLSTNGLDFPAYVPSGLSNVLQISCGFSHALALLSDGTVLAWGDNSLGQTQVPTDLRGCIAIAAGGTHSLALRRDGTVVAWGSNHHGQTRLPPLLPPIRSISAGHLYSLVVSGTPSATTPVSFGLGASGFQVSLQTEPARVYSLLAADSLSPPQWKLVKSLLALENQAQITDTSPRQTARFYKVQCSSLSP